MPKNKGKGGKNRRRGKNETDSIKRELIVKEEGQEYAQVRKMLGNGRLEAMCIDGQIRLCHIRGKLRKKVWINVGDLVLLGLRDFQDNKADVIMRFLPEEARQLKAMGHIPAHVNVADAAGSGFEKRGDGEVIFDDDAERAESSDESDDVGTSEDSDEEEEGEDSDESDDDDDKKNPVSFKKSSKYAVTKRKQERRVFKRNDDEFISGV